jgi:SAM-dependent methyltransferase
VAGLWLIIRELGAPLAGTGAMEVFSLGTLLGGITLLPLGAGVAGSNMIVHLGSLGVGSETALVGVGLFRAATTWYALGLGVLGFLRWRREIIWIARAPQAQQHFDTLAAGYEDEIPAHVRDRVVGRKVDIMVEWLRGAGLGRGARGLEIGCGHGWYAAELARLGYAISACDRSAGQIEQARGFVAREGIGVDLAVADACALPYADSSFDFAYSVNVVHHITGPGQRDRALREVVRVLKPGGSFFLHEINTENPLFALYMGYVFPVIRDIDDGTEVWVRPSALPRVDDARWDDEKEYLTFLPDFVPQALLKPLVGLERALERSRLRSWSAHYVARLVKRAKCEEPG